MAVSSILSLSLSLSLSFSREVETSDETRKRDSLPFNSRSHADHVSVPVEISDATLWFRLIKFAGPVESVNHLACKRCIGCNV